MRTALRAPSCNHTMTKARIGIDARPLSGKLTGIGRYVLEICHALDDSLPEAQFFAYSPKPLSTSLPSDRWISRVTSAPFGLGGYFWLKFIAPRSVSQDHVDTFFATRTLSPLLHKTVKLITLVHDLNHILVPRTMTATNRLAHNLFFRADVMKADRIIVNSRGTGALLERHIGRSPDAVIRPGVAAHFSPQPATAVKIVREKYQIQGPFLLSVATLEPRKNIASLIDAFISLQAEGRLGGFSLILVGATGWGQSALAERLDKGLPNIRRLGYVSDQDLPALYAASEAFVFPSLYEGYGIPVAEALACETRVVASNIPELVESSRGLAVHTDTNARAIAAGIELALSQPRPRLEYQCETGFANAAISRIFQ